MNVFPILVYAVEGVGPRLSIWAMILQAGPIVKFVLLILFLFSVISWAIIFTKLVTIRKIEKETRAFLRMFWESKKLSSVFADSKRTSSSSIARIFRSGYTELGKISRPQESIEMGGVVVLDPTTMGTDLEGIDNVERALRQATTSEITRLEKWLNFLATTGSSTPFIGLFGTVWGIMDSFREIGIQRSANLAAVAPGISEALVTTAAGLAAAIPAVIAFNYYTGKISVISAEMENFSSEFLNIVKRHFLAK
jgi:biopolymer transport protein TolQ